MVLSGYGLPGYGLPGYGLPGYGLPGYGLPGYSRYRSIVGIVYRGIVAVGLIMKFPLRGIMAGNVKKLSKLGARKGGSKKGEAHRGSQCRQAKGGSQGQRAGEGQEIFLHRICPSGRTSRRDKTYAKNPSPLLFVLVSLSPFAYLH